MIHRLELRVYYEDTDLAGIVYYANYLKFLERGRTEMLRAAGVDQSALLRQRGMVFVVRRVAIDYRRPARFDDRLTVETRIGRLRGASVEMAQRVLRGTEPLVEAGVTCACVDRDSGAPQRLPEALTATLAAGRGGNG